MAFKRKLLAVILAVVGLALEANCAEPVRCFDCTSSVSWQDCATNTTEKTCAENFDRCGKTTFEYGSQKIFVKGCRKAVSCERACEKPQNDAVGSKCSSECCQGNLCNDDINGQFQKDVFQCLECESSISKEDCERKVRVKTCAQGQDQCSESMAVSSSTKLYGKECATKEVCAEGVQFCERWKKQGKSAKCYHRCCSGKLCNTVKASASKLKCFNCESEKSWEHCEKNKKNETCAYGKTHCSTVSTSIETKHMSMERYRRSCVASSDCENPDTTCNVFQKSYGDDIKCKIDTKCCSEDFCNGYSSGHFSLISGFTLLSCVVIALSQSLN